MRLAARSGGGQFALDYTILGGTGAFESTSGFGLAFVDFDPGEWPHDYIAPVLPIFSVPEPGTAGLTAAGLLVIALRRRKEAR